MRIATAKGRITLALAFVVPMLVSCGGAPPPDAVPPNSSAPSATPADSGTPAASTPPSTETPASTPSSTPSSQASAPPPAAKSWDDMSKDQKMDVMKNVVMPKMKADFAEFNAKHAEVKCTTCHGDGVKDGSFKMPNPKLPKLSAADGFKKHMKKTPEMTKFMMTKIVPDMAAALNEQPYDPATKKGFGCAECHLMEK